jgi:hypothetical protein
VQKGGFDPQPKARRAWSEYKGAREVMDTGTTRPHRPAAGSGVVRGGAKGPTDDPAELQVAGAIAFDF